MSPVGITCNSSNSTGTVRQRPGVRLSAAPTFFSVFYAISEVPHRDGDGMIYLVLIDLT